MPHHHCNSNSNRDSSPRWQDPKFYLGLGKKNVTGSKMDLLGIKMLTHPEITWDLVAGAVPVIKGAYPWLIASRMP